MRINLFRFFVIILAIIGTNVELTAHSHLRVQTVDGNIHTIKVVDGMEIAFSSTEITITDSSSSVSYAMTDVSSLSYVHLENAQVTEIEAKDLPLVSFTPCGIEVSLEGHHQIMLVDIQGRTFYNNVFDERIFVDGNNLPTGVLILVVDEAYAIKFFIR